MINLECVPISMYCRATGESIEVINKRVRTGIWQEGRHVLRIYGVRERWIDLLAVTEWARQSAKTKKFEPNWSALD